MYGTDHAPQRGMTVLELVIAMVIIVTALLSFMWGLSLSVRDVGSTKQTFVANTAARGMIEEMKTIAFEDLYVTYGPGTAKETFAVSYEEDGVTYTLEAPGGGAAGKIVLCTNETNIPAAFGWVSSYDLNDDGDTLDVDVRADYEALPVLVRVRWDDGAGTRELEITTVLMDPKYWLEDPLKPTPIASGI